MVPCVSATALTTAVVLIRTALAIRMTTRVNTAAPVDPDTLPAAVLSVLVAVLDMPKINRLVALVVSVSVRLGVTASALDPVWSTVRVAVNLRAQVTATSPLVHPRIVAVRAMAKLQQEMLRSAKMKKRRSSVVPVAMIGTMIGDHYG